MHVRDATEGDAPTLASFADVPADVLRSQLHDRTVRVAVAPDDEPPGPPASAEPARDTASDHASAPADRDGSAGDDAPIRGFVSFDADAETVFVTGLFGSERACRRLLEEPIAFAAAESMPVEAVVPVNRDGRIDALRAAEFEERGTGPTFEGEETRTFRLPAAAASTRNDSSEA